MRNYVALGHFSRNMQLMMTFRGSDLPFIPSCVVCFELLNPVCR